MDLTRALPNWCNPERVPTPPVNPTTKRFPRTLESAFGAGTSQEIAQESLGWRVCDAVAAAMLAGALAAIAAKVFA